MADTSPPTEETPAQRQARIRRQKREAKIAATATERLDKITRLSGRTPESMRHEPPAATPPQSATPSQVSTPSAAPNSVQSAEQVRAQQEFLRAMMRQPIPQDGQQNQLPQEDDPMMKMLQAVMGGLGGMPDSGGEGPNATGEMGMPPGIDFNPDDIAKATGIPSFVTNMMMGRQRAPPTVAEVHSTRFWSVVHVLFALVAGLYLVFSIEKATQTFGDNPPAPPTFQNPYLVFATGEALLQGTRVAFKGHSGKSGLSLAVQMVKELIGDGAVVVFLLGIASWWNGVI